MAVPTNMECEDFLEFQEMLKKMRASDDKIIYSLNTSIPTDSFKNQIDAVDTCKQLYSQLQANYNNRESAIRRCIAIVGNRVEMLKNDSSTTLIQDKLIKKERTKLRLLGAELSVEEIIRDRTNKVYYERCRPFYKPPDLLF